MMDVPEPTWTSLLPALVTIVLAFLTRQVVAALFCGIVTGSLVLYANTSNLEDLNFVSRFLIPSIGTTGYARILLIYLWCLGGLIGVWDRMGATRHFAEWAGRRFARDRSSSLLTAWLLGVVFHQGGTVSTVLTGSTVKPIADHHRVSHEELSYVVDSTSSPIATIVPFNAWPAYVAGLVVGVLPVIGDEADGVALFMASIPFNFYALIAVSSTFLFSIGKLPFVFGRMKAARERVAAGGDLDAEDAQPMLIPASEEGALRVEGYRSSLSDFLVPLGVLLAINILPVALGWPGRVSEAFVAALLTAMGLACLRGMPLREVIGGFVDGCSRMTIGAIVLGLAVTIGAVAKELQTADYIVGAVAEGLPMFALPALLTLFCMGIAFATGTSWGTYAVVMPLALPLAWTLAPDPMFLKICFGAVIGGAAFGDQCSPISDTTILSSMFTGCDLMDHVRTQLPLALVSALLGIFASTLSVYIFVG
jgi:Na+/H+ antiporter NhaC